MANIRAAVPFPATLVVKATKNSHGEIVTHVYLRGSMYPTTAHPLWYCDEQQCPLYHGKNPPDGQTVHGRYAQL